MRSSRNRESLSRISAVTSTSNSKLIRLDNWEKRLGVLLRAATWAYPYWALSSEEESGIDTELKLVREAIAEEPNSIQAHLVAGATYAKKRRPEDAIREWKATALLLLNDKLGM